jgi:hypothetical protein
MKPVLPADLDSSQFSVRDNATSELEKLVELAEPTLRNTLAGEPSVEVRRRIEPLLSRSEEWSPERLHRWRALEILEHMGSPDAQQVLKSLAKGAPKAALTLEAQRALDSLAKRPVAP